MSSNKNSTSTNVIYERATFKKHCQQKGESTDAFVTDLHVLGKTCGLRGLKDEFIQDRMGVGRKDIKLYKTLIMISNLTLEGAVNRACQNEVMKSQ